MSIERRRIHTHSESGRNKLNQTKAGNLAMLLFYYEGMDSGDTERVLSLFTNNIRYQRGTEKVIIGLDELRKFYEEERIIAQGQHELYVIMISTTEAIIKGSFTGILKDGKHVDRVAFEDRMVIDQGKIARRQTIFSGREI